MNSIEERLIHDINAVTETLTVSEDELTEARQSVDQRVRAQGRRHRSLALVAAAAAVVTVGALGIAVVQVTGDQTGSSVPAGPGPDSGDVYADFLKGQAPTPENLKGFWRVDNGNTMVWFQTDGTVQFSDRGAVISNPVTTGTYTINGDTITVTSTDHPRCISGELEMRAGLPEPGRVNIVLADEPYPPTTFGTCGAVATTIALEHVVPTGYLGDFTADGLSGWKPVINDATLYGDWLAQGGGYLLEIARDGTYYIADDSADVVDNGYWRVRGGALELFSRTESPLCEEGDWFVLGDVEYAEVDARWLRGTVTQNDCGGGWTPASWVHVPDGSGS